MNTLFEQNYFQDELPFEKEEFYGGLDKIKILDWTADPSWVKLEHPSVGGNRPSLYEMRYKIYIEGYGESYLYIIYANNYQDRIFKDKVFYIKPFASSTENAKDAEERYTVPETERFKYDHPGVEIPEDLLKDIWNKIKGVEPIF